MRIIAGQHRGRKLLPPEGDVTRPITDRAKQSLFDILSPRIADSSVYDCFAGTGSMGLECLSRGAKSIALFEVDRSALSRLKKNIEAIDAERRCRVISGDLFRWFEQHEPVDDGSRADLLFLDPPYRFLREGASDLQNLSLKIAQNHLARDGIVIFRHDAADELSLTGLKSFDRRT